MTMRCSASPSTALYWPQVKTLTIPFLNSIIDVLLVVACRLQTYCIQNDQLHKTFTLYIMYSVIQNI